MYVHMLVSSAPDGASRCCCARCGSRYICDSPEDRGDVSECIKTCSQQCKSECGSAMKIGQNERDTKEIISIVNIQWKRDD